MGNEERFARSLGSFVAVSPSVVVEFDAGFRRLKYWRKVFWGPKHSISSLCFSRGSDFQNSAEFLADVLGLVDVLVLCEPPYVVKFRGDTCSAQDQECVIVFGKLKGDADSFLLKSIKNSTPIMTLHGSVGALLFRSVILI
jgi:hypothetical protein